MTPEQKTALSKIRTAANEALPDTEELPRAQHPAYVQTDDEYLALRMEDVLNNYVKQTDLCPACGKQKG